MIANTLDGELLRRKCRKDYSEYVKLSNPGFCMTHFHKYLCDQIQEFLTVKTGNALDILLLSVPPQHGKSFTVTETLPSWFLGKHPDESVIICSYESTFAEAFSRRNRDKFNKFATDVFVDATPNTNVQGVAMWETEQGGRCRAGGLKAGITGYPADLFIIDDPIKNRQDAMSDTIVAKIHDEMNPSVQTRIHPGGKLIVIQTRWIENDVIGWIESHWEEYIWKSINLPCECENAENDPLGRKVGDSLMGDHLNDPDIPQKIRNDNIWLKSKKKLILLGDGESTWNALYQGHPSSENGNLFHNDWWKLYERDKMSFNDFDYTLLSVDASFKQTETSDFVAMTMWGLKGSDIYLWKLVNKRMGFVATCDKIKQLTKEFPTLDNLVIEDKANGSAIIDTLNYIDGIPPIVAVNPIGGKFSRAQAVSPFVATGVVHIPTDWSDSERKEIEWTGQEKNMTPHDIFIQQHSRFPFAKNDDIVDSTSQALARLIKLLTGEEPKPRKRVIRYVKWYPDMWDDYNNMSPYEQDQFILTYGAPLEWQDGYVS